MRGFNRAVLTLGLLFSTPVFAGNYPLGFSLFAPSNHVYWQAPDPESSVCGLRIGLIRSLNTSVCGLDIGFLISETREKFSGMSLAGFANINDGDEKIYLFQVAGLFNGVRGAKIWGLQFAFVANDIRDDGKITGLQAALLWNHAPKTNVRGFQVGAFNQAMKVTGIQFGLLNITSELTGLQIGLLNFNRAAAPLYFFPGINFGY